jgi:hypothetical protein
MENLVHSEPTIVTNESVKFLTSLTTKHQALALWHEDTKTVSLYI